MGCTQDSVTKHTLMYKQKKKKWRSLNVSLNVSRNNIEKRKGRKIDRNIFVKFYHSPSQVHSFHLKLFPCRPLAINLTQWNVSRIFVKQIKHHVLLAFLVSTPNYLEVGWNQIQLSLSQFCSANDFRFLLLHFRPAC